jgi:sarcosine oxidase subunit gamma
VLSKLFAIDFALLAFPVGSGVATVHHDIFAQIQRTGEDAFDAYVFRSFARSFWKMLGHAAEEAGYEVR